jgi:hypothetical protein
MYGEVTVVVRAPMHGSPDVAFILEGKAANWGGLIVG